MEMIWEWVYVGREIADGLIMLVRIFNSELLTQLFVRITLSDIYGLIGAQVLFEVKNTGAM